MNKKISKFIIYTPIIWFIIGFVIYPLINTLISGFIVGDSFSFENYIGFLSMENGWTIVKNTFILGISTVLICGIIGTFLALAISLIDLKGKKLLNILLLTPMMIPGVLIVLAFIQLYGESGIVTRLISPFLNFGGLKGFSGILFIHAYTQYIFFYTNVSASLNSLDYSQIEAAKSMGAGNFSIFTKIIIPFIKPALFSSAIITFMSGISSFSAPNLLGGYKVLSTQIMYSKINNRLNFASMQVTLMILMGISVMFIFRKLEEKSGVQDNIKSTPLKPIKLNSTGGKILKVIIWLTAFSIILPIICVIFFSFTKSSDVMTKIIPTRFTLENYKNIFSKPRVLKPFINSIKMTFEAILATLLITLPSSYLIVKHKNKFTKLLESGIMLPIAMPVGSIAVNLINAFNTKNVFSFGKPLIGTYAIFPIAYIILTMPTLLRSNIIAMRKFNSDLEYSAKSLGANDIKLFFIITLREILPFVVSGAIIAYIRVLGEYTVSAFLYGIHNKPLSIAMVNALQEYDISLSMAYGALTILICFIGVATAKFIEKHFY